MSTLVLRNTKGSALTFTEGDNNFTNLNNDKIESISADTTPALGGNLTGGDFVVSQIKLQDYEEVVYNNNALNSTTTINLSNGNVQRYTDDGFTFNGFTTAVEGASVTLIKHSGSNNSGIFNVDGSLTKKFGNDGATAISNTSADDIISIIYLNNTYYISIAKGYQ
jgi:hypothetical protein|tara:strand:+ start:448 stop:945 length:498 start_codon:yes stop_codon:yes gene_type:complete